MIKLQSLVFRNLEVAVCKFGEIPHWFSLSCIIASKNTVVEEKFELLAVNAYAYPSETDSCRKF